MYWFVLSMLICFGCAAFYLRRTAPVYQRSASVLVKDSRKGSSSEIMAFNDLIGGGIRRSVDNEIYIFQSRRLMEEVVGKLDLTIQYTQKGRIRVMDLYGRSPILVKYINAKPNEAGQFKAHIVDEQTVELSGFNGNEDYHATVTVGDTVSTPMGSMIVRQTPYISQHVNRDIIISKKPLNETIEAYRSRLRCDIRDKQASVISLTMGDVVPKRAEDVINGIIEAYNNDAISDKRAISDITDKFINERLAILGKELTDADSDVAAFKQTYKIYSPEDEASHSATELSSLKNQSLSLEGSLEMARYIRDFINNDATERSLIPAATVSMSGASAALASQIAIYNEQVLNRQRLLANASANSPVIIELDNNIASLRDAIISSLDSHIKGLSLQLDNIRREQSIADTRMTSSPVKE
ncbi:MAG: chromosome partitioning protein ParA, partial [Alistipes sp.]|nr:chromosome partitioning protein ParA [Alistipes sp.]